MSLVDGLGCFRVWFDRSRIDDLTLDRCSRPLLIPFPISLSNRYDSKETYDSKFGSLGSPYEECRAEGIAHYLVFEPKVLEIFGYRAPTEVGNLIYATFYELVLAGIESLKMYSPSNKKWLQAHSQANYVLLRVLLESPDCRKLIKIDLVERSEKDGKCVMRRGW